MGKGVAAANPHRYEDVAAHDGGVEITPESVLSRASELHRRATGEDDYVAIWPVLDEARPFGRPALEAAFAFLTSTDQSDRAVACDLIGVLCNPDEDGWGPEAATALIGLAGDEEDTDVLWSIARALGYARDHQGVTVLAALVGHPDSDVRFQVAQSLPSCEDGADPEVLAGAMLQLMEDADEQVRDWATFGLGTQTDIDGPEVREALFRRLGDDNLDARDEAILGLARRRERSVTPRVENLLREDEVGRLTVEAAAYLADERLFGSLRALEGWWDLDAELLGDALAACDPDRRAAEVADQSEFLARLEDGLTAFPGVSAWICCERFGRDVTVEIEHGGEAVCYEFRALLMNRAGGDVQAAVYAVLGDISRSTDPRGSGGPKGDQHDGT